MTSNKSNRLGRHHLDVMAKEEDDEWLFESIVAFLSSPIWSAPIQQFFEANCSLFSPEDSWSGGSLLDDDDDLDMANVPIELIQVHVKYKDLVDTLINSFLQDIGVSYSQFTKACKNSSRLRDHPVYLELFEQVWCAENFKLFKAQMVRKNVELELQALVLLQYQLGIIQSDKEANANGDEIMAIVIRKSKDEYESLMKSRQMQQTKSEVPLKKPQDLETAKKLVKSDKLVENLKQELNQQEKINRIIVQEELTEPPSQTVKRPSSAARKTPNDSDLRMQLDKMKLEEVRGKQSSSMATPRRTFKDDDDDIVGATSSASAQIPPPLTNITHSILAETSSNLDPSELERRAEFMRKQRDLLNKKKNEERQKQLDAFMRESERSGEPRRPMSSRAARAVLSGADPVELQQPMSNSRSEEERKKLEARRALAETLKREVINNSGNGGAGSSSSRKN